VRSRLWCAPLLEPCAPCNHAVGKTSSDVEVYELDVQLVVNDDVVWLDIAVTDLGAVNVT
jgi:hypothetical protein